MPNEQRQRQQSGSIFFGDAPTEWKTSAQTAFSQPASRVTKQSPQYRVAPKSEPMTLAHGAPTQAHYQQQPMMDQHQYEQQYQAYPGDYYAYE